MTIYSFLPLLSAWLMLLGNPDAQESYGEAQFTILMDGEERTINYNGKDHLIFAERYGKEIWIRLAESKSENGEKSPHLDIDLCFFSGAGTYTPVNPGDRPCKQEFKWDVWWHGEENTYANKATSTPCNLILEVNGDTLSGSFSCSGLILFKGKDSLDITQGSFSALIRN